jgi:hypothetical protein
MTPWAPWRSWCSPRRTGCTCCCPCWRRSSRRRTPGRRRSPPPPTCPRDRCRRRCSSCCWRTCLGCTACTSRRLPACCRSPSGIPRTPPSERRRRRSLAGTFRRRCCPRRSQRRLARRRRTRCCRFGSCTCPGRMSRTSNPAAGTGPPRRPGRRWLPPAACKSPGCTVRRSTAPTRWHMSPARSSCSSLPPPGCCTCPPGTGCRWCRWWRSLVRTGCRCSCRCC